MTTFDGREIRLLIVAASQIDLKAIDIEGSAADEIKSVIYKAKSIVSEKDGLMYVESFKMRSDR